MCHLAGHNSRHRTEALILTDSTPTAEETQDVKLGKTVSTRISAGAFARLMRMTSKGNKAQAEAPQAAAVSSAQRQEKKHAKAGSIKMEHSDMHRHG